MAESAPDVSKQIRCPRCGRLLFVKVAGNGAAKVEIVCRSSTCKGTRCIVSV